MLRHLLLGSLLGGTSGFAQQPLVVTTNTILRDLTEQLTGGAVRVVSLVPSGTASVEYEPTDDDVALMNEARLVVANGAGYEPWLKDLEKKSTYDGLVVVTTDGIPLYDVDGELHEIDASGPTKSAVFAVAVEFDPYAWLDPLNAVLYIEHIRNGLADFMDGTTKTAMDERATALIKEVRDLHFYAEKQFAAIPVSQRVLVTPHDSLRYFAAAYDFRIVPITGLASGQELRPAIETRLIETIRNLHQPAVFFERTANVRETRRLNMATGVKMVTSLYTTDVGSTGTKASTYVGMMRSNVDAIVDALRDTNAPTAAPATTAPATKVADPKAPAAKAPAASTAQPAAPAVAR